MSVGWVAPAHHRTFIQKRVGTGRPPYPISCYSTINSTINKAIKMNSIAANTLKTQGVLAIERALADQPEASVTVRGQVKYVVMGHAQYVWLRECELEAALAESRADVDAGRFVKESVSQHMARLAQLAAATAA